MKNNKQIFLNWNKTTQKMPTFSMLYALWFIKKTNTWNRFNKTFGTYPNVHSFSQKISLLYCRFTFLLNNFEVNSISYLVCSTSTFTKNKESYDRTFWLNICLCHVWFERSFLYLVIKKNQCRDNTRTRLIISICFTCFLVWIVSMYLKKLEIVNQN